MTKQQEKLLETFIRKKVRKSLNEEDDSWSNSAEQKKALEELEKIEIYIDKFISKYEDSDADAIQSLKSARDLIAEAIEILAYNY